MAAERSTSRTGSGTDAGMRPRAPARMGASAWPVRRTPRRSDAEPGRAGAASAHGRRGARSRPAPRCPDNGGTWRHACRAAAESRSRAVDDRDRGVARERHIAPWFSDLGVDEIDERKLDAFLASLGRKGCSPKMVRNVMGTVHSLFELARRQKVVRANPCQIIDLPKVDGATRRYGSSISPSSRPCSEPHRVRRGLPLSSTRGESSASCISRRR